MIVRYTSFKFHDVHNTLSISKKCRQKVLQKSVADDLLFKYHILNARAS